MKDDIIILAEGGNELRKTLARAENRRLVRKEAIGCQVICERLS